MYDGAPVLMLPIVTFTSSSSLSLSLSSSSSSPLGRAYNKTTIFYCATIKAHRSSLIHKTDKFPGTVS